MISKINTIIIASNKRDGEHIGGAEVITIGGARRIIEDHHISGGGIARPTDYNIAVKNRSKGIYYGLHTSAH